MPTINFTSQKISTSTPGDNGYFGTSVSTYQDTSVVGAPGEAGGTGQVHVFTRDLVSGEWSEFQVLSAPIDWPDAVRGFGKSVSLYGDILAISAPGTDVWVPDPEIGVINSMGTVYIYTNVGGTWELSTRILPPTETYYLYFGANISLYGNDLAVATENQTYDGPVYVFHNTVGTWNLTGNLHPASVVMWDVFGGSVSMTQDLLMVGAPGKTTGLQESNGCVYVFEYTGTEWVETDLLTSLDYAEYDSFGSSVCATPSRAIISAPGAYRDGGAIAGQVYEFTRTAGIWTQGQVISSTIDGYFGASVSFSDEVLAVGSPYVDSNRGTAYFYTTVDGAWVLASRVVGLATEADARFGNSVSVYGGTALIGSPGETTSPFIQQGAAFFYKEGEIIPVDGLTLAPFRRQEKLVNSSLFKSASIYDDRTQNKIYQLPVYDPFKAILPGPAKQNLYYISLKDPARYNVTPDVRLYSDNITFADEQVGRLWWDTSSMRYIYYEQPKNIEGTETDLYNIEYRRNHWGEMFPGSSVDVYEWVKSSVPPSKYKGSGTPRDINTYVEIVTANRLTNSSSSSYYFWVKDKIEKPNLPNRTLAALQVANLIKNPKSLNFAFFSPIMQASQDNSYLFYNVQSILAYRGSNIQIQYRLSEREDQEHVQWQLYRDGDPTIVVSDQFWDKMVDSLCGYTAPIPASDEYINGILVFKDMKWDAPEPTWGNFHWDGELQGEILPVPDPSLSEQEKYGIEYRPRQGMFVNVFSARKVFVQAANELLKKIPIIEENSGWNVDIETNNYWTYTTWYATGYEGAVPTIVFQSITEAVIALSAGSLSVHDIVQVTNAQTNGRFVLYSVIQSSDGTGLTLEEIAIQDSAIVLLDSIFEVRNNYNLSVELRQILNALRTQVFINDYRVDQNKLFFSMMNYVMSEQKSPDWLFKTSYIYVKENDVELDQKSLLQPDKTESIIGYINDAKPYHTKLREYTTSYSTFDLAYGTTYDFRNMNISVKFGPLPLDFSKGESRYIVDARTFTTDIEQFISREDVYTVELTNYDPGKRGYSQLYPFTFPLSALTLDNPQTFVPERDVVGIQVGTEVLIYGRDYFVEYNNDLTYTVYFYSMPAPTPVPVALIWIDGGKLEYIGFNAYRNETALVYPKDGMVVLADTKLPANDVSAITGPTWAPKTVAPYVGWGDVWESLDDTRISGILESHGGMSDIPWDSPLVLTLLPEKVSFRQNTDFDSVTAYYRNGENLQGFLLHDLLAPTESTDNIQTVLISVSGNVLPDSRKTPGVIWIDGERIEYIKKRRVSSNVYELSEIRRATNGTSAVTHLAFLPDPENPGNTVNNKIWIERGSVFPINSQDIVWNANIQFVEDTENPPLIYTNAYYVPLGGLWYARTPQAAFLKKDLGSAINE